MDTPRKPKSKKRVWNRHKAVGQMAPVMPDQVRVVRALIAQKGKPRDPALFNTAISRDR